MTKQLKPACEFRQYGQNILVKFKGDKKQRVFSSPMKEARENLKKLIEQYNKLPNEGKKNKIIALLEAKSQKAELVKKAQKKKTDHEIKELQRQLAEEKAKTKKLEETLQLAEHAGANGAPPMAEVVEKAKDVPAPVPTTGVRRPGEYGRY
jgi:tRNA/tmRNA/rRNA uracil-C5-methylase (TrmA/RlmC/RlmD family)